MVGLAVGRARDAVTVATVVTVEGGQPAVACQLNDCAGGVSGAETVLVVSGLAGDTPEPD